MVMNTRGSNKKKATSAEITSANATKRRKGTSKNPPDANEVSGDTTSEGKAGKKQAPKTNHAGAQKKRGKPARVASSATSAPVAGSAMTNNAEDGKAAASNTAGGKSDAEDRKAAASNTAGGKSDAEDEKAAASNTAGGKSDAEDGKVAASNTALGKSDAEEEKAAASDTAGGKSEESEKGEESVASMLTSITFASANNSDVWNAAKLPKKLQPVADKLKTGAKWPVKPNKFQKKNPPASFLKDGQTDGLSPETLDQLFHYLKHLFLEKKDSPNDETPGSDAGMRKINKSCGPLDNVKKANQDFGKRFIMILSAAILFNRVDLPSTLPTALKNNAVLLAQVENDLNTNMEVLANVLNQLNPAVFKAKCNSVSLQGTLRLSQEIGKATKSKVVSTWTDKKHMTENGTNIFVHQFVIYNMLFQNQFGTNLKDDDLADDAKTFVDKDKDYIWKSD